MDDVTPGPTPLEHLPEDDWSRALAIVAHPDDMEYGAGAAVARWTGQGKEVVYCLVTSGEAGIDGLHPDQAGPLREAEQLAACAAVGVSRCDFLRRPDGVVEYGVELRRLLAGIVRRHRPDIVLTHNFRETWEGGFLNQADHMAVGRAVVDAVRDAGNRWIFPEQLGGADSTEGLEPWDGVRAVWAAGSPRARHGVDITDSFEAGIDSLLAHQAYLAGLGQTADEARGFLTGMAQGTGARLGAALGVAFEVIAVR
ncbi:PIG-L deacetylase family protein [Nocardioides sp.]|uniref:PIG-L deacetylase family protein n=1 Tax=Nocardioides sp. TaxID=35761 RepID=UPI003519A8AE